MENLATNSKNLIDQGILKVNVLASNVYAPISQASISILTPEGRVIEKLNTDISGQSPAVSLKTPPLEYSMESDSKQQPYSNYNLVVTAPGFETVHLNNIQILPNTRSISTLRLTPSIPPLYNQQESINIDAHTLFSSYPPKIPEAEIQPIPPSGEIVLSRVVIPEYIVVHDGSPNDSSAPNYYVRYQDYIKNVACNEIYATWPESTIYANILAIMSFTLNRVYTEFYRNKMKNFTITSSTAFDQKWVYGRNIYSNIDYLVDSVFANYLSKPGIIQPLLTSYCDGKRVTCKGLSQWGSKYLGDEGYSAIEILRYYYGNDLFINTSSFITGVPSSYPGYVLTAGVQGKKVYQLQEQLNRIAKNFPAIPTIAVDGIYGPSTTKAVKVFQEIFNLPPTGNTDYPTWYTISNVYVGVTEIAEP